MGNFWSKVEKFIYRIFSGGRQPGCVHHPDQPLEGDLLHAQQRPQGRHHGAAARLQPGDLGRGPCTVVGCYAYVQEMIDELLRPVPGSPRARWFCKTLTGYRVRTLWSNASSESDPIPLSLSPSVPPSLGLITRNPYLGGEMLKLKCVAWPLRLLPLAGRSRGPLGLVGGASD
jgi:hypothetical protein